MFSRHSAFVFIFFIFSFRAIAQEKLLIDSIYRQEKLQKSASFAALTFGGDILALSGGTISGANTKNSFGANVTPRLTIGGQHFWGHADFYVHFPLPLTIGQKPTGVDRFSNKEGIESGLKIYPYAMRPGRLSPYIGVSFQRAIFGYSPQSADYQYGEATYERFVTPIHAGVTYSTKKMLFTAGIRYNNKNKFDFYESKNQTTSISLNPLSFNLGVVRYMDTDIGMASTRGVAQQNLMYALLKKHNRLSDWYCAIGPSTALQMSKSPYFAKQHPYFHDNMLNSSLIPDVAVGRYFHRYDFNIGLSARAMSFKVSSFDTQIKLQRATVSLEAYKFLGNYHGFVPFLGSMLSFEHLRFNENGNKEQASKPALGVIFGWDIRVTQTGTGLLRTNLRYTPNLNMNIKGEKVMLDHLEFNFIQYVKFFGRGKVYAAYSSKK